MSPVCASIDIIPLRRDKIELKSKTGYYLSAKTFCLGWETAAATVLRSDSCCDAGFPPGASTLRFSKRRQRRQRTKEIISDWIEKSVGLSSDLRGSLRRHWTPIKINRRRKRWAEKFASIDVVRDSRTVNVGKSEESSTLSGDVKENKEGRDALRSSSRSSRPFSLSLSLSLSLPLPLSRSRTRYTQRASRVQR